MAIPILDPKNMNTREAAARAGICALTVMTKAPRPGSVKTRLCPPLTAEDAAELNVCFLRDTAESLAVVAAITDGKAAGLVAYTPVGEEGLFEGLLPPGFALLPQRGHGFGERLAPRRETSERQGDPVRCPAPGTPDPFRPHRFY